MNILLKVSTLMYFLQILPEGYENQNRAADGDDVVVKLSTESSSQTSSEMICQNGHGDPGGVHEKINLDIKEKQSKFPTKSFPCSTVDGCDFSNGLKKLTCPHCDRGFANSQNLYRHIREIHQRKTVECKLCGRNILERNFAGHKKICRASKLKTRVKPKIGKSNSLKSLTCSHCDRSFANRQNLYRHNRDIHQRKSVECKLCGHFMLDRYFATHEINCKTKKIQYNQSKLFCAYFS